MSFNTKKQDSAVPLPQRQSNMELLRIVTMFLVLVVHADFFALGEPTISEVQTAPLSSFIRLLMESVSIISVNVFVLLSGYFGIHTTSQGACRFLFQCAFFLIGIYVVLILAGLATLTGGGIGECLFMSHWNWFIRAYLLLYLLSPVLNAFATTATKAQFRGVLISFYLFSSSYAWIENEAQDFQKGYSVISFIGLYLLSRYVRIHKPALCNLSKYSDLAIWGGITLCSALFLQLSGHLGLQTLYDGSLVRLYMYSSPLVILCALYFLLFFSKLHLPQINFINWMAASSFAVFLLHMNANIAQQYFAPTIQHIYQEYPLPMLWITVVLLAIFLSAVLLDQIRIFCWRLIISKYCSK